MSGNQQPTVRLLKARRAGQPHRRISERLYFAPSRIIIRTVSGFKGCSAMELSCFDGGILASTMSLNVTAVFIILAAFAAFRLVAMSGEGSVDQLQTA
ncbi:MAG: hypothetical protein EOQ39_20005 [Mesorhizobium sp.]|nr:hypothetical protein EN750_14250 [Mesorhizobium sp. M7A.F.Ca.ET.027.03.2.1]RWB00503.1 MAG: hypothetical protein EOQ37_28795 [Mesorhizobium sp.]RWB13265.1 MAG: hypothetical protein EOQ39_20005 [Mesorhizobium sp.]TIM20672.1 MAG: hypothetical protein E5Y74_17220 [Mesorhizobium sp.]